MHQKWNVVLVVNHLDKSVNSIYTKGQSMKIKRTINVTYVIKLLEQQVPSFPIKNGSMKGRITNCKIGERNFQTEDDLIRNVNERNVSEVKNRCEYCLLTFMHKKSLNRHVRIKHKT